MTWLALSRACTMAHAVYQGSSPAVYRTGTGCTGRVPCRSAMALAVPYRYRCTVTQAVLWHQQHNTGLHEHPESPCTAVRPAKRPWCVQGHARRRLMASATSSGSVLPAHASHAGQHAQPQAITAPQFPRSRGIRRGTCMIPGSTHHLNSKLSVERVPLGAVHDVLI